MPPCPSAQRCRPGVGLKGVLLAFGGHFAAPIASPLHHPFLASCPMLPPRARPDFDREPGGLPPAPKY
ncbi:hypothetical protein Sjap_017664 [Stephania japonica]|uniref:Uncharacterized protein n=1 Tax=Stephania japonica TaxID=461633 RepID=A0AAP0I6K1_9MAGN